MNQNQTLQYVSNRYVKENYSRDIYGGEKHDENIDSSYKDDIIYNKWSEHIMSSFSDVFITNMQVLIKNNCYTIDRFLPRLFSKHKHRFILICLCIKYTKDKQSTFHENAIIIENLNQIYRYEPHGHYTYYNHEKMDSLLKNYFSEIYNNGPLNYHGPLDYQLKIGYQQIQHVKATSENLIGFCATITKLFMHTRLIFQDDVPFQYIDDIMRSDKIGYRIDNPEYLHDKVKAYATWILGTNDKGNMIVTRSFGERQTMNDF